MTAAIPMPITKPIIENVTLVDAAKDSICKFEVWGVCFITPQKAEINIFSFGEFLGAIALLLVLYTITDIRYRFRIRIAPINLVVGSFLSIFFIGFSLLLSEYWFHKGWVVPFFTSDIILIQVALGALFLVMVLLWLWFAFIFPPRFNAWNYKKYGNELYRVITKGLDSELPIIADELGRSAKPLVQALTCINDKKLNSGKTNKSTYAYDILSLIGNRRFCYHVAISSPRTAVVFIKHMQDRKSFDLPIGHFVRNFATEAIANKESVLYHERDEFNSGLLGYHKPFSKAIYSDYLMVEGLAFTSCSPLDLDYDFTTTLDSEQLKTYSECFLITFRSYLEVNQKRASYSWALNNAMANIKRSCRDLSELNQVADYYPSDILKKLQITTATITKMVRYTDKYIDLKTKLRIKKNSITFPQGDIFDSIAKLMFSIIFNASGVKEPYSTAWSIQYSSVWNQFFSLYEDNSKWKILHFKVRRLIYDEIKRFEETPCYVSASLIGYCLNVMGVEISSNRGEKHTYNALHKVVLAIVKRSYLKVAEKFPDVADACLIGGISFDKENKRLVKSYIKGLNKEAPKDYLYLEN